MNIIFEHTNDRYIQCLASAASSLWREEVNFWNKGIKPTLDMVKEIRPDLIIVNSYTDKLLQEIAIAKKKGFQGKFVLISDIPVNGFDCVLQEIPCVNLAQLAKGIFRNYLYSYSSILIDNNYKKDPLIYPILSMLKKRGGSKIFGKGSVDINMSNYMGTVTTQELADVIASCDIYIDFTSTYGGLDSHLYGDYLSLLYKSKDDMGHTFNSVEELEKLLDEEPDRMAVSFLEAPWYSSSYNALQDTLKEVGLYTENIGEKIALYNTMEGVTQ